MRLLPVCVVTLTLTNKCQRKQKRPQTQLLRLLLHVLRICLVLILVIVVILIFLLFVVGLLGVVLLLLLSLFHLAQFLPFFREAVSLRHIISNNNVVEDGPTLNLPEIEADEAEVRILVDSIIILVFRVCDFLRFPESLIGRVRNSLGEPLTFVLWVVLHWCLPLAILLIVPIIWFLGFAVHNSFLLDPIVWLLRLWIINHGIINPIVWLLVVRIRDFLRLQNFPILFQ